MSKTYNSLDLLDTFDSLCAGNVSPDLTEEEIRELRDDVINELRALPRKRREQALTSIDRVRTSKIHAKTAKEKKAREWASKRAANDPPKRKVIYYEDNPFYQRIAELMHQ